MVPIGEVCEAFARYSNEAYRRVRDVMKGRMSLADAKAEDALDLATLREFCDRHGFAIDWTVGIGR